MRSIAPAFDARNADNLTMPYARVTEVQLLNGESVVVLKGGGTLPASEVTAVRQAGG